MGDSPSAHVFWGVDITDHWYNILERIREVSKQLGISELDPDEYVIWKHTGKTMYNFTNYEGYSSWTTEQKEEHNRNYEKWVVVRDEAQNDLAFAIDRWGSAYGDEEKYVYMKNVGFGADWDTIDEINTSDFNRDLSLWDAAFDRYLEYLDIKPDQVKRPAWRISVYYG